MYYNEISHGCDHELLVDYVYNFVVSVNSWNIFEWLHIVSFQWIQFGQLLVSPSREAIAMISLQLQNDFSIATKLGFQVPKRIYNALNLNLLVVETKKFTQKMQKIPISGTVAEISAAFRHDVRSPIK